MMPNLNAAMQAAGFDFNQTVLFINNVAMPNRWQKNAIKMIVVSAEDSIGAKIGHLDELDSRSTARELMFDRLDVSCRG